ncbi:hypothetical protein JH06_3575 [Blastocystis sp. subtype 4]|uniref:hypothetical protein n=1 Tax=Blastocystis sp. subtype 4 TaxID=944170 RepID=UPI0007114927|nr:hypothetical protein JH06_3575 [Blastocystis sp. subtype 4]KNB42728.1 hypothetical protein JH06_3575 [Blastocystis sp. subtype 4]|eukprot:XP_014526171.1 hypothetical protein JH06_3575 [Blastocystis sp. subtype 4]
MTKGELISRMKERYPRGFTLDQLAVIDILCPVLCFNSFIDTLYRIQKMKWTVYRLSGSTSKDPSSVNPKVISRSLTDELYSLIPCHVYSMVKDGILWTRVLMVEPILGKYEFIPSSLNDTTVTYIAHMLGSNYMLTSPLSRTYSSTVLTTFCMSIQQASYTPLSLSGSDVKSLLALVMNTNAGGFSDYLNQLKEKRPLEHGTIESTIPALMQKLPDNVHILDEKVVMENHVRSESEWGIADPPALQQLIVNSKVDDHQQGVTIPDIHMSVVFQGPNVLKGLKQFSEYGYATKIPIQISYNFTYIPRDPKNVVTIGDLSEEEDVSD